MAVLYGGIMVGMSPLDNHWFVVCLFRRVRQRRNPLSSVQAVNLFIHRCNIGQTAMFALPFSIKLGFCTQE